MLANAAAAILLVAMIVYVLSGGADFGGGIWQLFATGPRAGRQRSALRHAIAPIWEANHVWLIVAVVVRFVAFPAAFSAIATALHSPLALMLIGIVLRGSAFAFRSYPAGAEGLARRAERVFAAASVGTPLLLGVVAGAIASGGLTIGPDGRVVTDFVSAWLAPFPFAVGGFALALCAYLSAIYMTVEANDPELADDFRTRALAAAIALGAFAVITSVTALAGAPALWAALFTSWWSLPFHAATGVAAVAALASLAVRRYHLARGLAAVHAALIIAGWGFAQYPALVAPDLTIAGAAAPDAVLRPLVIALAAGAVILVPAFVYLFRVFKKAP